MFKYIIILFSSLLFGQEIHIVGTVFNERGNTVPNASIRMIQKNLQTYSNNLGKYELAATSVKQISQKTLQTKGTTIYNILGRTQSTIIPRSIYFSKAPSREKTLYVLAKISAILDTLEVNASGYVTTKSSVEKTIDTIDIVLNETPVAVTLSNPTNITDSSMTLTWNTSKIPDFFKYEVYRNGTLIKTLTNITDTSLVVTGLKAVTIYTFYVKITDKTNLSNSSKTVTATTDKVPSKCGTLQEYPATNRYEICDERDARVYVIQKVNDSIHVMNGNLFYIPPTGNHVCAFNDTSFCKSGQFYDFSTATTNFGNGKDICPDGFNLPDKNHNNFLLQTNHDPLGYYDAQTKKQVNPGTYAFYWTSTTFDVTNAYYSRVSSLAATLLNFSKANYLNVRCMKIVK